MEDPESGIREFFYAIGTTPGGTEVKPFTSTTQNSAIVTGLTLQPGTAYYFSVKAVNASTSPAQLAFPTAFARCGIPTSNQDHSTGAAERERVHRSGIACSNSDDRCLEGIRCGWRDILGSGIRNPWTISLNAGQQYAKTSCGVAGNREFRRLDSSGVIGCRFRNLCRYRRLATCRRSMAQLSVTRRPISFCSMPALPQLSRESFAADCERHNHYLICEQRRIISIPAKGRAVRLLIGSCASSII